MLSVLLSGVKVFRENLPLMNLLPSPSIYHFITSLGLILQLFT